MPSERGAPTWLRNELLTLLSVAATLAGLCITALTLVHGQVRASMSGTVVDDGLALSALLFLLCTYVAFFALRTRDALRSRRLERSFDTLFILGLTCMVGSGFIMVYTVL